METESQGKGPIPDELWAAAVEVARKEGINRTSRELHVEWDHLKRRMAAAGEVRAATGFAGVCGTGRTAGTVGSRMHS